MMAPSVVAWWKQHAGSGPMDVRCARLGPTVRDLMGIADIMPACLLCRRKIVLRETGKRGPVPEPPRWVTIADGDPVCHAGADIGILPGDHKVPPLVRPVRAVA